MHFLFIILLSIFTNISSHVYGTEIITQSEANDFIVQMEGVMNTRSTSKINDFFQYYMLPSAKVHKESLIVTEDTPLNTDSMTEVNYTKAQYIDSLKKIVSFPGRYQYSASLNNLTPSQDGNIILNISIEETIISGYENETSNVEKNFVATNCNVGVEKRGGYIVINSMSCFEKIIFDHND